MPEERMNIWQSIQAKKWEIFSALLAILVLGLSIFVSSYSTLTQNAEMAEVNKILSEKQAKMTSDPGERDIYNFTADLWRGLELHFGHNANLRQHSISLCIYSLLLLFITFILLFLGKLHWAWIIPFTFSLLFFAFALSIYVFDLDWRVFDIRPLKLIDPGLPTHSPNGL